MPLFLQQLRSVQVTRVLADSSVEKKEVACQYTENNTIATVVVKRSDNNNHNHSAAGVATTTHSFYVYRKELQVPTEIQRPGEFAQAETTIFVLAFPLATATAGPLPCSVYSFLPVCAAGFHLIYNSGGLSACCKSSSGSPECAVESFYTRPCSTSFP